MGDNYGRTLFAYRSIGATEDIDENKLRSYLTYKSAIFSNAENDKDFYRSLTKLITKTLVECFGFTKHEVPLVEHEVERVFKTNVFNSYDRSQERARKERQYPSLKDFGCKKEQLDQKAAVNRVE